MKKLVLFLVLLSGCGGITTSKGRCDNLVALEKEQCIRSYDNYNRHMQYRDFRGGGRDF